MQIQSARFGLLDVDEQRIITFPRGLLGYPQHQKFALIQTGHENYFFWLQAIEEPKLAFVVTDPSVFSPDFCLSLKEETQRALNLDGPQELQVLVICNKAAGWLTGNLQGPLAINVRTRIGQQIVLNEKRWSTRQPLLRIDSPMPLACSA
jgi:flagellar assembly factor FliW